MITLPPMTPEGQRDRALVERVLAGAPQAVEEYAGRMVCVLHTLAALNCKWGSPFGSAALDDLVQETGYRVYKRLRDFEGRSRLETWVHGFCARVFREALRKCAADRAQSLDPASFDERGSHDPAQPEAELERFYRVLSPMQGRVLYLYIEQGYEFVDIAAELGQSTTSVKTHWSRAKEKIRPMLEEEGPSRGLG